MPGSYKKLYPDSEEKPVRQKRAILLPKGCVMVRLSEDGTFNISGSANDPAAMRCAMELDSAIGEATTGLNHKERKFDA